MKNNNKKKTIVLIIIYTLILFASMVGATFAYFTSTATGNTSKVTLKASTLGEAYASGTSVILKVTDEDMQQINSSNEYTAYKESNEFNELTLTSSVGDTFKKYNMYI
jgi:flagellar basal body-associated protein FliL